MRNPNWTRDELILALNLYYDIPEKVFMPNDERIIQLSSLLNKLPMAVFKYANDLMPFSLDFQSFCPPYGKGLIFNKYIDFSIMLLQVRLFKS